MESLDRELRELAASGDAGNALIFSSVYLTPPPPKGVDGATLGDAYGTAAPTLPQAATDAARAAGRL